MNTLSDAVPDIVLFNVIYFHAIVQYRKMLSAYENILSGTFKPFETTYFLVYIGFPKH